MIKFLRTVVKPDSVKKYLLYALGEIILVSIGILIALGINNSDERGKRAELEKKILREIKLGLSQDVEILRSTIAEEDSRLKSSFVIWFHLIRNQPYHDSLDQHFARIIWHKTYFNSNTSAFENLSSHGFDLIKNNELRERLIELYSYDNKKIDNLNSEDIIEMTNHIEPFFRSNFTIRKFFTSAKPTSYSKLIENEELKSLVFISIHSYQKPLLSTYRAFELNSELLISLINQELGIVPTNKEVVFKLKGHLDINEVYLAGNFNNWNPRSDRMNKTPEGWEMSKVLLSERTYQYKFVLKGLSNERWIADPLNKDSIAVQLSVTGSTPIYNSLIRVE